MGSARKAVVGAFVLGGLVLFGLGLFLIGDRKHLFERSFVVYADFQRLAGLQDGARVRVAGRGAGEVLSISYPRSPRAKFRVEMRVIEALHPLVRTDSVALIQTEGLVGDKLVEIGEGSEEAPPVADGGTIESREPFELSDLMQKASDTADSITQTVDQLGSQLEATVDDVQTAIAEGETLVHSIGRDVKATTDASRKVAEEVQGIVTDVRAGKGTAGKLLEDDALYRQIRATAENAESASADARKTLANVKELTSDAKAAVADLKNGEPPAPGMVADIRQTLDSAREATSDLAENMESLKHEFFFRGLFERRGFYDLDRITPREYVSGILNKEHRLSLRLIIPAKDLVELTAGGSEVLSENGKAKIRAAMNQILRHSPTSPLVVEGYAESGPLERRYVIARRRAFLVRQYIVDEFHRNPNYTGFIALVSVSFAGGERRPSSGVVLALYYNE